MEPKIIRSEKDYDAALAHVDRLMSAKPGTPELDELKLWTLLVEAYEDKHYSIDRPDPVAAIQFRMEQQGLKQVDLIPYIGSKSKVSEVLSGRRSLSIAMIRRLHEGLGIPAEILIGEGGSDKSTPRKGTAAKGGERKARIALKGRARKGEKATETSEDCGTARVAETPARYGYSRGKPMR